MAMGPFWSALLLALLPTAVTQSLPVPRREIAPRGWNGFDSHLNHINETQLNATAEALAQQLLPHGYNYLVMDAGWFSGTIHDQYGRPRPNDTMYPSTRVAAEPYPTMAPMVDAMRSRGLELGIWYIRGAFAPAVAAKTPVKGTPYTLDEIVNQDPEDLGECLWDRVQIAVNASHPGAQPYYDSLAQLFVEEWGVSFVKFDCAYLPHGVESSMQELLLFASAMRKVTVRGTGKRPQLSISPGGVRINQQRAQVLVDQIPSAMYRIWPDYHGGLPLGQLNEAATLVEMGLYMKNGTMPDWDMLPGVCATTMALWCVTGAPLMYGYALPADDVALGFLTNSEALLINAEAMDPQPFLNAHTNLSLGNVTGWRSELSGDRVAVALVNIGEGVANVNTAFVDLGLSAAAHYDVLDVFAHRLRANVAVEFSSAIPAYVKHNKEPTAGAVLYLLTPSADPI
jgi:alpha-galactosidase